VITLWHFVHLRARHGWLASDLDAVSFAHGKDLIIVQLLIVHLPSSLSSSCIPHHPLSHRPILMCKYSRSFHRKSSYLLHCITVRQNRRRWNLSSINAYIASINKQNFVFIFFTYCKLFLTNISNSCWWWQPALDFSSLGSRCLCFAAFLLGVPLPFSQSWFSCSSSLILCFRTFFTSVGV
jgi:hypothetical protein